MEMREEKGFALVESFIAMFLLVIGMVGMLSLFALSIATVHFSEDEMIARQKAREMLESIYTARNTSQVSFDMVRNVTGGGIFLDGFQPLLTAGADGLLGTVDDGGVETIHLAGPDGALGTGDDEVRVLSEFQRSTEITPLTDKLRQVTITIEYTSNRGLLRQHTVTSYVSAFR